MRARAARIAIVIAAVTGALVVLYFAGVNLLLRSSWGRGLINRAPEIVEIHFSRATTPYPFRFVVDDLTLRLQDGNVQIMITADHAEMSLDPWALLRRRVHGTRVRGQGLGFRLRQKLLPGDDTPAKVAALPPIAGFTSVRKNPADARPLPTWLLDKLFGVALEDIDVNDVREVWVDDYRLTGKVDVRGGFYYQPLKALALDAVTITVKDATLRRAEHPVFSSLNAELRAQSDTIDLVHLDKKALKGLSAELEARAHIDNAGFANVYLKKVPQLRLGDGAGELEAKIKIAEGRLARGSSAAVRSPKLSVIMPDLTARGAGELRWRVSDAPAQYLAATIAAFSLWQTKGDKALAVRGRDLTLTAHSADVDLTKAVDLTLKLEVGEAEANDLRFMNAYIPEAARVALESGSGRLSGHFEITTVSNTARGEMQVAGENIAFAAKHAVVKGRVKVRAHVTRLDLDTLAGDYSSSFVSLEDVSLRNQDGVQAEHWWARLDLDPCAVDPAARAPWVTSLSVKLQNARPLVLWLSGIVPVPWAAKALSDLRDVHATAGLRLGAKDLELRDLHVTSGMLDVAGFIVVNDLGAAEPRKKGAFLAKLGKLELGVEIKNADFKLVLANPASWFALQKTPPATR